jgi:hypothetical protein
MMNFMFLKMVRACGLACVLLAGLGGLSTRAADGIQWNGKTGVVSAELHNWKLDKVLAEISTATGWQVFVDPLVNGEVSIKFLNKNPEDALRLLLGDLNYARVSGTNSPMKLLVFKTSMDAATQAVAPAAPKDAKKESKVIPDELIVRIKPGVNIDEIAKKLGAKVVGRIDSLNAYRLKFDDAESATAARTTLGSNSDVASIENNYSIDRPEGPTGVTASTAALPTLQLKQGAQSGHPIIGLVDTGVQKLGGGLDAFISSTGSVSGDTAAAQDTPTHGTAVAMTILHGLQSVTGNESSWQIAAMDVFGNNTTTSSFDVAMGLAKLYSTVNPSIYNLSLGSYENSAVLQDVVSQIKKGNPSALLFSAVGNEPVSKPMYPAAYSEVIGVTSAGNNGTVASYANTGGAADVKAPGTVVVPYNGKNYVFVGTSIASGDAAGAGAGLVEARKISPEQAVQILKTTMTTPTPASAQTPAK